MPGWSCEIANEFIREAAVDARFLDQSQLQRLVYIAHGWCLARFSEPLTGDRPEAWDYGPMYVRLADALARWGNRCVEEPISTAEAFAELRRSDEGPLTSDLEPFEREIISQVYKEFGAFAASQLSTLTRRGDTPWARVFAGGSGRHKEIPHSLIRDQVVTLTSQEEVSESSTHVAEQASVDGPERNAL